jgi:hypothetical protein
MATNDVILEEDNDSENNVSLHAEGGHFVTDIEPLSSNLLRNDLDYAASAALQEGIGPNGMPLVNLDGSLFEFEGYGDDVNGGYSSDEMFVPFTGNGGDAEGTSSLKEQPNKARKVHKRSRRLGRRPTKISLKGKALATFNKKKKQQYKDSREAKRAEMKASVQAEKPFPPRPLRELALMEKLDVGQKGAHILLSRRRESNNSSKKASNSDTSDGDGDEDSLAKKARKSSVVSFFPARAAW